LFYYKEICYDARSHVTMHGHMDLKKDHNYVCNNILPIIWQHVSASLRSRHPKMYNS